VIKTIVFIIVIAAAIITASIITQQKLFSDSSRIVESIEKAEEGIKSNDWGQAKNQIDQIIKQWEDAKGTWSSLVDHQEIDNIDVTISRLQTLVKSKDDTSALQEAAALKKFVGHIPNKEKLTLENIF
jgi:hypothetical protein